MSSLRSRNRGKRIVITVSRQKRSWRKRPADASAFKSRWVAAQAQVDLAPMERAHRPELVPKKQRRAAGELHQPFLVLHSTLTTL